MHITAAVLHSRDAPFRLEQLELAAPGAGEILVEIAGVGLCHTDLLPRTSGFLAEPPIVLGHEGSGVVAAVGPGVEDVRTGDHVLLSFDSCGLCAHCASGRPAYCSSFFPRNLNGRTADRPERLVDRDGAAVGSRWFGQSSFATHAVVGSHNAVVVDDDLPHPLLGPLACSIQTGAGSILSTLRVGAGSSVAVYGTGAVGLAAVMAARVAGATTIVAVDLHDNRLELARELGATHAIHGDSADLTRAVRAATGGGARYALDTTGVGEVIAGAVDALCPTGTLGLVGYGRGDLLLPPHALARGRTVTGILEGGSVPRVLLPQLIALWRQGRFPFDRFIRTYPLDEINQAERDLHSGTTIKAVLLP